MLLSQTHRQWLHIQLPDSSKEHDPGMSGDTELSPGKCPCKGVRVWTKSGLFNHGLQKTTVPANTGGTIIFEDIDGMYAIRWDNFQITMHVRKEFIRNIICIGQSENLSSYLKVISTQYAVS